MVAVLAEPEGHARAAAVHVKLAMCGNLFVDTRLNLPSATSSELCFPDSTQSLSTLSCSSCLITVHFSHLLSCAWQQRKTMHPGPVSSLISVILTARLDTARLINQAMMICSVIHLIICVSGGAHVGLFNVPQHGSTLQI